MFKVYTIHQKDEWREVIGRAAKYDFYHTWSYHSLDRSGMPLLFVYNHQDDFIAFPFIQRSGSSALFSVYGYVGPVSNKKFKDLDPAVLEGFREEFSSFLKVRGFSSVTSRLHPFIDQTLLIQKLGGEMNVGKSVLIDLSISIEEQRKNYRRNLWGDIRKLQAKGYHLREGSSDSDIRMFKSIYWENMERIGAEKVYFFNEQYFFNFMRADDFQAKIVFVIAENRAVCASLIALTKGIIQGYLIGTRTEHLWESPAKLLVDQVSILGRNLGMQYYNLGGGLNFEEDQLFRWKSGFSRACYDCSRWTYSNISAV